MRLVVEDLDFSYSRQADAEDCFHNNTANVLFLEDQINNLQRKLQHKEQEFHRVEQDIQQCEHVIDLTKQASLGLYLR